eukprot:jgi/Tetstr1/431705/TSEL_021230.t1
MAKELRKSRGEELFAVAVREVFDAVAELRTDQSTEWTEELKESLMEFADIIAEPTDLPPEREFDFEINLESDEPPKERTYRMSPAELQEVRSQLEELLAKGWIRPSKSNYGAPILFVRKKDGTMRMCVDYRKLNDLTKKDRTPLPRIDELLDSLHGATIFSTLDMYKGYHQVRIKPEDIHKTAFRTHYGLYEYCVLPFGLTNAPAGFQTMMNRVLSPYLGKFCVVYLDDVLIYSKTAEEHLDHIRLVLRELQRHHLHIKLSKCSFGRTSVEFLGHVVEAGQIKMEPPEDASGFAVGDVLLQDQGSGLRPVAYHARKMNKHEVHYPVHEQELLAVRDALIKFRCYLDGAAGFTVITDHDTLRHFFRQRDLSTRQVRWLQVFAPYQRHMDIVYKRGAANHADALSRRPDLKDALQKLDLLNNWSEDEADCEINSVLFAMESRLQAENKFYDEIKTAYDSDEYLKSRKALPSWLVRHSNGLLYAYGSRLYVPNEADLRQRALYELHDAPTAGHPGGRRLLARTVELYWWPRMKQTVTNYVRRCPTCQRTKAARHKPYGLLQPHDVPSRPFEVISLDLITDLPECQGYDSVVIFVCLLSKRVIVEPTTKTIIAEGLAEIMHRSVFRHFGLPAKLISDRDPRFMSELWQDMFKTMGTKLNISTAFHPATDGQTERTNQTWEQVLRCYVHPLHDDWVNHLTNVEFAINAAQSTSTTMSPFKATLGFEPTTPATTQLATEPTRALPEHVKYVQELHRFAHDCVLEAQTRMQTAANRKRLPVPFKTGDRVKLKASHLKFIQQPCAKLRDRSVGPFVITEQISPVAFRLQLPAGVRVHDVVHASMLEKWYDDPDQPAKSERVPIVHDANRFHVQDILDVAFNNNGTGLLFRVRWAFPYNVPSEDTWEPLRGVKHLDIFRSFLLSKPYRQFTESSDFIRFRNRYPSRVPSA